MINNRNSKAEFVTVWEFRVRAGKRRQFEKAYGPDGAWVKLFRRDKEYIRTDLLRDLGTPRRYVTVDVWSSRAAYLRFKKRKQREYDEIDRKSLSLTEGEVKMGEFYRVAR